MAAALGLLALSTPVHALQTVTPTTAGGVALSGVVPVPAGSSFSFFGIYTDDSAGVSESGLGLKVKYNGLHLTNVSVTEEYTKCRIAAAQYPASNVPPVAATAADQAVFGWIDTSIRTLPALGAVGWPDLADAAGAGVTSACLNPGTPAINTDFAAGTSVAPGQKLFKFTATMAASCTTAAACSSTVTLDSDNNFSYANASPGYTVKSFTINGAAAPTLALAASNPVVSRKTHGGAGVFDIPVDTTQAIDSVAITVEPRQDTVSPHLIVFAFNTAIASVGNGTAGTAAVQTSVGASAGTATAVVNGSTVEVTLTGIADVQRVNVSLTNVAGTGVNAVVPIGFVVGDISGNGKVNATDVGIVKGQSSLAVVLSNFRSDVSANGTINATDVGVVKGKSGLPGINP